MPSLLSETRLFRITDQEYSKDLQFGAWDSYTVHDCKDIGVIVLEIGI